jgi:hypothetical protein
MTLPKKASRDIEVNGKTYRWMAKRVGEKQYGTTRLTVENLETGEIQQRLFRGFGLRGVEEYDPPRITPADVKQFILERFQ